MPEDAGGRKEECIDGLPRVTRKHFFGGDADTMFITSIMIMVSHVPADNKTY